MFFNKSFKEYVQSLHGQAKHMLENEQTEYIAGYYNGIETILARLEDKEPNFAIIERTMETKEEKEKLIGRTVASGIRRRGGE